MIPLSVAGDRLVCQDRDSFAGFMAAAWISYTLYVVEALVTGRIRTWSGISLEDVALGRAQLELAISAVWSKP